MRYTIVILLMISIFIFSCETVPVTGRKQLSLISSNQVMSMSFNSYNEFLKKNEIIKGTKEAEMVKRVGENIKGAVEKYFKNRGMTSHIDGYKWEFNLIKDKSLNAWAMPGGKVVVYTGILPVAHDDTGLAVVLGHEIAHAIAEHGKERMSQGLAAQLGGIALNTAISSKSKETQELFMTAFGLGTQVGILLPYSRIHESEADHLGLIFMTMAGYDPNAAVGFWQRMSSGNKGAKPPEFLSTHPSDETRIRNIRSLIPEAMRYKTTNNN